MIEDGYDDDHNGGIVVIRIMRGGSKWDEEGLLIALQNLNGQTRALPLTIKK